MRILLSLFILLSTFLTPLSATIQIDLNTMMENLSLEEKNPATLCQQILADLPEVADDPNALTTAQEYAKVKMSNNRIDSNHDALHIHVKGKKVLIESMIIIKTSQRNIQALLNKEEAFLGRQLTEKEGLEKEKECNNQATDNSLFELAAFPLIIVSNPLFNTYSLIEKVCLIKKSIDSIDEQIEHARQTLDGKIDEQVAKARTLRTLVFKQVLLQALAKQ